MVQLTLEEFHAELKLFPQYRYNREDWGEYNHIHRWYGANGKLIAERHEDTITGEERYYRPLDLP